MGSVGAPTGDRGDMGDRGDLVQVRTLRTWDALQNRLQQLGLDMTVDPEVDPTGALAQPLDVAGRESPNRFCVLPMEGWDGEPDGTPSNLVQRRWRRFGASGAGIVWVEATAVQRDGRANPRQLVIDETTVDALAALRGQLVATHKDAGGARGGPVVGLQLTHSGRWSRPQGEARPRVAYRHPLLDDRVDVSEDDVIEDAELDRLVDGFVHAAVLVQRAGFDFVDVKHCHGYLGHELLSAVDRPGRYGGDSTAVPASFGRSPMGSGPRHHAWGWPCGCRPSMWFRMSPAPMGVASQPASSDPNGPAGPTTRTTRTPSGVTGPVWRPTWARSTRS